jgi:hypothetical protein
VTENHDVFSRVRRLTSSAQAQAEKNSQDREAPSPLPPETGDSGDKVSEALTAQGDKVSPVFGENRGQLGTEPGTEASEWTRALQAMAERWEQNRSAAEAAGQEPTWLEDDELTGEVAAAIRVGDLHGTRKAIAAWQTAWERALGPPPELKLPPKLKEVARGLSATKLNRWLDAPDPARQEAARRELHARADQILEELGGLRPPPNPSVHRMFDEARKRFGSRDLGGRSITAWLRKNAPEVAAVWPEAPVDAAWIDWRQKVGPDHNDVLDRAWSAATGQPRYGGGERHD